MTDSWLIDTGLHSTWGTWGEAVLSLYHRKTVYNCNEHSQLDFPTLRLRLADQGRWGGFWFHSSLTWRLMKDGDFQARGRIPKMLPSWTPMTKGQMEKQILMKYAVTPFLFIIHKGEVYIIFAVSVEVSGHVPEWCSRTGSAPLSGIFKKSQDHVHIQGLDPSCWESGMQMPLPGITTQKSSGGLLQAAFQNNVSGVVEEPIRNMLFIFFRIGKRAVTVRVNTRTPTEASPEGILVRASRRPQE